MVEIDTIGKITVAIESAIGGGSISLLRGRSEVACWLGSSNISRAEDLLANIDALLTGNGIERGQIDLVAVSAGPGSFTGIRIGLATALGLTTGLGIAMSSESALMAIARSSSAAVTGDVVVAVPSGRNAVCLQRFQLDESDVKATGEPQTITADDLHSLARDDAATVYVVHAGLYEMVVPGQNIVNFGANVAYAVGLACTGRYGLITEPLFISKSF